MAIIQQSTATDYTKTNYALDSIQTTTGTQTTAYSIPININQSGYIVVSFIANSAAYSTVIGGNVQAVFARASGNISRTSSTTASGLMANVVSSFLVTQPSVDIVANTGTQAIDIKITGVASTTINWHLEIISYTSN